MAKLVTRTFTGTKMDVLIYDKDSKITYEVTITVPNKKFRTEKALEKVAKERLKEAGDNVAFVAVTRVAEFSEKRSMTVQHFFEESEIVE